MAKRYIIVVLAILMVSGMTACGSSTDIDESLHIAADDAQQRLDRMEDEEDTDVYEEESGSNVNAQDEDMTSDGVGIVAILPDTDYNLEQSIDLVTINPDNGKSSSFRHFTKPEPVSSTQAARIIIGSDRAAFIQPSYFNEDYTKVTADEADMETKSTYAGWVDQQGNFTNVSELIFGRAGEFSGSVTYNARGFDKNGYFYFSEGKYPKFSFYRVPQDNVSEDAMEEVPLEASRVNALLSLGHETEIEFITDATDWIDDTTCLLNCLDDDDFIANFYLHNAETDEDRAIIPDLDNRSSWNGIISPNGKEVVFMSAAAMTRSSTELFRVGIDGGEPEKLETDVELSSLSPDAGGEDIVSKGGYRIIDWIE